jgi:SagB-type dehydrogenase family enzyme
MSPQRFWDDTLNELLGVDGQSEAVCALHLVGHGGAVKETQPPAVEQWFEEKQQIGAVDLNGPVPERFHEATKLAPTQLPNPSLVTDAPVTTQPIEAIGLRLPASAPSAIRVSTAIRRRRSARAFDRPPVSLHDLSFVLQAAQGNPALERAAGVEIYVVASAVVGLEPGVYRYQSSAHQLVTVRKGEFRDAMVDACLRQKMAGSAAVGFAMAARLDAARSPLGDRRYRDVLLESGAVAQRIYLAAEAVGLAARNLAAYVDDRFNELLQLDRRGRFALHLTMLGHGD